MSDEVVTVEETQKWIILGHEESVEECIKRHTSLVLCKPVQSGKTSDVFSIVEKTYKDSVTIFVSDKNVALSKQTNSRAKIKGFTVFNFNEVSKAEQHKLVFEIPKSVGKKKIFHFLMEKNNLDLLSMAMTFCINTRITLIIDEADKNKNVGEYDDNDDEEKEPNDGLPIITRRLFGIKNKLKAKNDGSRVILVTATPQSLLVCEHDEDRMVIYKNPYKNYVGAGLDHKPDVAIRTVIHKNDVPASERWTGSHLDTMQNTFRSGVVTGIDEFMKMESKDPTVKQVMLISLESRNACQERMAKYIYYDVLKPEERDQINIVVFNGTNKFTKGMMLSEIINEAKARKVCIIAGFMAARGVSFTDFSDSANKFELCVQVHNTKQQDPLNSALQAMRVFGPGRRTITRPLVVCNKICEEDLQFNFVEAYRVVRDLAIGLTQIDRGDYDTCRPLTQSYNFRYMLQTTGGRLLLYRSPNQDDWLPITTLGGM